MTLGKILVMAGKIALMVIGQGLTESKSLISSEGVSKGGNSFVFFFV